jgi:hypothetical protein
VNGFVRDQISFNYFFVRVSLVLDRITTIVLIPSSTLNCDLFASTALKLSLTR